MDADDIQDYLGHHPDVPPIFTANPGPCACFIADIPDWSDTSQSNYTKAFEAILRPFPGPAPPGLSIHEALPGQGVQ